jgi:homogentisate 1,2-dioxygenase
MQSTQLPAFCRDKFLAFDGCVRNHAQHLLVAPHVVLKRRDIEVAHENGTFGRPRPQARAVAHLVEKGKLVREFWIDRRVRQIPARRHVEIMQRDRLVQARSCAEYRGDVAAVGLAAEALDVVAFERQAREHHHAVITLLPIERDML